MIRRYRYKCISVKLFKEENRTITDGMLIYYNLKANKLHIYSKLNISGRQIVSFPICYDFTDTKCENALKESIREVMRQDPFSSTRKIRQKTGHDLSTICRYYMALKRELSSLKLESRREAVKDK